MIMLVKHLALNEWQIGVSYYSDHCFRIRKRIHHAIVLIWMLEKRGRVSYESIHKIKPNIASSSKDNVSSFKGSYGLLHISELVAWVKEHLESCRTKPFPAGIWSLYLRQPEDLFPSSLTFVQCKILAPLLANCEVWACGSEEEIHVVISYSLSTPTVAPIFT